MSPRILPTSRPRKHPLTRARRRSAGLSRVFAITLAAMLGLVIVTSLVFHTAALEVVDMVVSAVTGLFQ